MATESDHFFGKDTFQIQKEYWNSIRELVKFYIMKHGVKISCHPGDYHPSDGRYQADRTMLCFNPPLNIPNYSNPIDGLAIRDGEDIVIVSIAQESHQLGLWMLDENIKTSVSHAVEEIAKNETAKYSFTTPKKGEIVLPYWHNPKNGSA